MQRQGTPTGTQIILNKEGEYEVGISTTGSVMWALATTSPVWGWQDTGYVLPTNQWSHVAVSYNGSVVETYVNGTVVHSQNVSGVIGDVYSGWNELTLGGRQNTSGQRFQGLIDEVRVWNVGRTGAQIAANYNATLTGAEAGLVGYWRFTEATGLTANDLTANANNGRLGGGVPANEPERLFSYRLVQGGSLAVPASGVLANASDAEGSPLTAVLVSGPAHAASFTLNPDGSFTYTPVANYQGSDSFVFRASDGSQLSQPATVALTVAAKSGGLWLSVRGSGSVPSGNGGLSFSDDTVIRLSDPDLSLGAGVNTGTFSRVFEIDGFAADGNADINGLQYVRNTVTIGTVSPVTLLPGDILLTTKSSEVLGGVAVTNRDVVLFRPTNPGDYSSGTFSLLLRDPGGTGRDIRGAALVETATNVGGTILQPGEFLLVHASGAYDKDIQRFQPTTMGGATTGGTLTEFIDGQSAGISFGQQIYGIALVERTTVLGGQTLLPGQLLITLDGSNNVGTNALAVTATDIFVLKPTATGAGTSSGAAAMLVRGADLGLTTGGENIDAVAFGPTIDVPDILVTPISVTPLGTETRVNTATADIQTINPNVAQAVATDANGNYVVVWASNLQDGAGYGVYAQRFNADGTPAGAEFRVNTTTANDQLSAAVAMDTSGNFVVTWMSDLQDGSGNGIYAQRYNAAGVAQGVEFRVNATTTGSQSSPAVAMSASGSFAITWTSGGQDPDGSSGVYGQRYNASGGAQGGEFRVNSYTTGAQQLSAIAMDATGNFIVTWASDLQDGSNYGVYAQRYNASGIAQGGEFLVNSTTVDSQLYHDVAMMPDGRFVVAYQSRAGTNYEVYIQRYSADGFALGGETRVNTATVSGYQPTPSVSADGSGNITVVWNSSADGAGAGVIGRRLDWTGTPIGGEFVVNSTTAGNQYYPEVVAQPGGRFIVAWGGNGPGDADGVFVQRYGLATSEAGGTATFQVRLNTQPTANVTVTLSSSNTTEGTLSSASLTFTPANWNAAQAVTLTGVDDLVMDGAAVYTAITAAATSADGNYNDLNAADVSVANFDNDTYNTLIVDTVSDAVNGNTTSITALLADKGVDGRISLREAILAVNATVNGSGGADRILFNIPGVGPHTINVLSALPTITDSVIIDGTSEPDFAGAPMIELNGAGAGAGVDGLRISASNSTIRGLVLNRFSNDGIEITGSSNTIVGNYIGLGLDGVTDLGNTGSGIEITGGGTFNVIGSIVSGDGNVISGNTADGITLAGGASGTTVLGNVIGADAGGTLDRGNAGSGIAVISSGSNYLGGVGLGAGNLLFGNDTHGVLLSGAGSDNNDVFGNVIESNTGHGVLLSNTALNNRIGGPLVGQGNTIASNSGSGVVVHSGSTGTVIQRNAIYSNTGLGIDLSASGVATDGVTFNDAGDVDSGGNSLQNFPVLSSVFTNGSQVRITGSLDSAASTTYRIELFASTSTDPGNHGEGQRYLGYIDVATEFDGLAVFDTTLTVAVAAGEYVTATATDPSGNTSEFSLNAVASLPIVTVGTPVATESIDSYVTFAVQLSMPSTAPVSVDLALANGTATGGGVDFGTAGAGNLQVSLDDGATWNDATSATIAAGATSFLVRTPIVNDGAAELPETFTLTATRTGGSTANASATGTATIYDNNGAPIDGGIGNFALVQGNRLYSASFDTGRVTLLTTSPYVAAATQINSLGFDSNNSIFYYTSNQSSSTNNDIYGYDARSGVHFILTANVSTFGVTLGSAGLGGAGGDFNGGSYYFSTEGGGTGGRDQVYRVDFVAGTAGRTISTITKVAHDNFTGATDFGDILVDSVSGRLYMFNAGAPVSVDEYRLQTAPTLATYVQRDTLPGISQAARDRSNNLYNVSTVVQRYDPAGAGSLGAPITLTTNGTTAFGAAADAGAFIPAEGTIGDRVWYDADTDGVQDVGETGRHRPDGESL